MNDLKLDPGAIHANPNPIHANPNPIHANPGVIHANPTSSTMESIVNPASHLQPNQLPIQQKILPNSLPASQHLQQHPQQQQQQQQQHLNYGGGGIGSAGSRTGPESLDDSQDLASDTPPTSDPNHPFKVGYD